MTPLGDLLARRIAQTGPITLADYMAECLLHPEHGYYTTGEPFGTAGDFTTAPEISQMFGEMLGLCLAQAWLDQGGGAFTLAELGPGRGTLMADILRATKGVPGFHAAADLVLVEASPRLRAMQAERLPARHVDRVHDLPDGPLFLVANEFFDALPIRQFVREGAGWRERVVGPDLTPGLSAPLTLQYLAHRLDDTQDGDVVEICPQAAPIMEAIAQRVAQGGLALIVDYGGWRSRGDTFQALSGHASADPFAAPGRADLTAHVDFEALALAAMSCAHRYTTQGRLLAALGIGLRAERLAVRGNAATHLSALERLTDPAQMGELFKALAITPPAAPPPPGFA
ncbi:class I SAM-dependent methyltransferase [Falsirhodobacter sp. 20TX0035]|uniref:class I SAM-dependent methyltransferase n=1 Tax=Falsirhodobacter sp. 20TX0035 TaxID=3022019 RepID=UPI00232DD302|nr:SAM-dependent methyltransferase [Falsirhodobacter sp. 20TX0035]MDB6453792.1 SAM-dependent methyltransferase [Falsirhodobacter sp. 20TX0035]